MIVISVIIVHNEFTTLVINVVILGEVIISSEAFLEAVDKELSINLTLPELGYISYNQLHLYCRCFTVRNGCIFTPCVE